MDINYQKLFDHVTVLKKVLLISGGRSGSGFFQSLLDGHSEILQLPGDFFFYHWWDDAKCKGNLSDLLYEFAWYTGDWGNHAAFFKSVYNTIERWDQLGENRNDNFAVDMNTFMNHMTVIFSIIEFNRKNFFSAIHLAYGLTLEIDIKQTQVLFFHIHHINKLDDFSRDFPTFDVIFTIREPRNLIVSDLEHWKRFARKTFNANRLYYVIERVFHESEAITKYTKSIKTLKLEDLHLSPEAVLKEFCKTYNLKYQDQLLDSTWHGKKWWGDAISGKYLDGFNRNIQNEKWRGLLFYVDNFLIEFLLEERLKYYDYTVKTIQWKILFSVVVILIIFPMKYEIKILIDSVKRSNGLKNKLAALSMSARSYVRRIILYYSYLYRKLNDKIFLADTFLTKREQEPIRLSDG